MTDWGGVRERVHALRETPGSEKVFGARDHGFLLEDPLTEDRVSELEAWIRVRLPEEYRDFLLTVGAGGAGPIYGVFPLRRRESGWWDWIGDGGDLTAVDLVAAPFQDRLDASALAAIEAERPDEEDFEDDDEFDAAFEAWDACVSDLLWAPERTAGAVCLCHVGCAERIWLVVTGPERGRMWTDPRCDAMDLAPMLTPGGEPVTFAGWYLDWLREAETACGLPGPVG